MKRLFCLAIVLLFVVTKSSFSLTSGPAMPEYGSFVPVDVKDMVNISTGDFNYTIPLANVNSANGAGYPITLGYGAGILHEQEASWVGLGWTLNAGSITRAINGAPDDQNGEYNYTYTQSGGEAGRGWTTGFSYMGFTAVGTFDWNVTTGEHTYAPLTYSGYSFNGYGDNESPVGVSIGTNFKTRTWSLGVDYNFNKDCVVGGSAGLGISFGPGQDIKLDASVGVSIKGYSANYSFSSEGVSGSYNLRGVPINGRSGIGFSTYSDGVSSFYFGTTGNIYIAYIQTTFLVGFNFWNYSLSDMRHHSMYGYLYQGASPKNKVGHTLQVKAHKGLENVFKTMYEENPNPVSAPANYYNSIRELEQKFEYTKFGNYNLPSQDAYKVSSQGISGIFKPFAGKIVKTVNSSHTMDDGIVGEIYSGDGTSTNPYQFYGDSSFNKINSGIISEIGEGIVFKMINEPAFNFVDDVLASDYMVGDSYETFSNKTQGTLITPLIGLDKGKYRDKLSGFILRDQEGKTYYYTYPLFNHQQVSYTNEVPVPADEPLKADQDPSVSSITAQTAPYAYTWLLTAVTGPDYVRNESVETEVSGDDQYSLPNAISDNLMPKDGDYGFWARFYYGYGKMHPSDIDMNREAKPDDSISSVDQFDKVAYLWRLPYYDGSEEMVPHHTGYKNFEASFGMKDVTFLKSIETSADVAFFNSDFRDDGLGVTIDNYHNIISEIVGVSNMDTIHPFDIKPLHRYVDVFSGKSYKKQGSSADVEPMPNDFEDVLAEGFRITVPYDIMNEKIFWESLKNEEEIGEISLKGTATYRCWGFGKTVDRVHYNSIVIMRDTLGCEYGDDHKSITQLSTEVPLNSVYKMLRIESEDNLGTVFSGGYIDKDIFTMPYAKCVYARDTTIDNMRMCNLYLYAYNIGATYKMNPAAQYHNIILGISGLSGDQNFSSLFINSQKAIRLQTSVILGDEDAYSAFWPHARTRNIGFTSAYINCKYAPTQLPNVIATRLKKLNDITIYSKKEYPFLNGVYNPKEDPESDIKPVSNIKFNYDYSLARNTPNSRTPSKGRLTLKSLTFGAGDPESGLNMPPYRFHYQNAEATYKGAVFNDPWGFQEGDNFTDLHSGVNWNLCNVELPSGGKLNVNYSRDEIFSAAGSFLKMKSIKDKFKNDAKDVGLLESSDESLADQYINYYSTYKNVDVNSYTGGKEIPLENTDGINTGAYCLVRLFGTNKLDWGGIYSLFQVKNVDKNNNTITLNQGIDNWQSIKNYSHSVQIWFIKEYHMYAGNLKVDSLSTSSVLGREYKKYYKYTYPGRSFSIDQSVMPYFFFSKVNPIRPYYEEVKEVSLPFAAVSQGPNIIYPEVIVSDDRNKSNGYTQYEFNTDPLKYIAEVGDDPVELVENFETLETYNGEQLNVRHIIDRSTIFGSLKSIKQRDDNDKVISSTNNYYCFSDDVNEKCGVYDDDIDGNLNSESKKALGLIQYRTLRKMGNGLGRTTNQSITDIQSLKPFLYQVKTTFNNVEKNTYFKSFNAKTGKPMISIEENWENNGTKSKLAKFTIPYFSLLKKNNVNDQVEALEKSNIFSLIGAEVVADVSSLSNVSISGLNDKSIILSGSANTFKMKEHSMSRSIEKFIGFNPDNTIITEPASFEYSSFQFSEDAYFSWEGATSTTGTFQIPLPGSPNKDGWKFSRHSLFTDINNRILSDENALKEKGAIVMHPRSSEVLSTISNANYTEVANYTCDYMEQNGNYYGDFTENTQYIDYVNGWELGEYGASGVSNSEVGLIDDETLFGKKVLKVKNAFGPSKNVKLELGKDYVLTFWIKDLDGGISLTKGNVANIDYRYLENSENSDWPYNVNTSSTISSASTMEKIKERNGWSLMKVTFNTSNDLTSSDIDGGKRYGRLWIGCPHGGEILLSDIRFYPKGSHVVSYFYDYNNGKLISVLDENNNAKFFKYDLFGRFVESRNDKYEKISSAKYSVGNNNDADKYKPVLTLTNGKRWDLSNNLDFEIENGQGQYNNVSYDVKISDIGLLPYNVSLGVNSLSIPSSLINKRYGNHKISVIASYENNVIIESEPLEIVIEPANFFPVYNFRNQIWDTLPSGLFHKIYENLSDENKIKFQDTYMAFGEDYLFNYSNEYQDQLVKKGSFYYQLSFDIQGDTKGSIASDLVKEGVQLDISSYITTNDECTGVQFLPDLGIPLFPNLKGTVKVDNGSDKTVQWAYKSSVDGDNDEIYGIALVSDAPNCDIYYRARFLKKEWKPWQRDGDKYAKSAGTAAMEGLQVFGIKYHPLNDKLTYLLNNPTNLFCRKDHLNENMIFEWKSSLRNKYDKVTYKICLFDEYPDSMSIPIKFFAGITEDGESDVVIYNEQLISDIPTETKYWTVVAFDEWGNEISSSAQYYFDTESRESDSVAIVYLYAKNAREPEGNKWFNIASDDITTPINQWPGVTVSSSTGRVISLNCSGNDFDGELARDIYYLSELKYLNFRNPREDEDLDTFGFTSIPDELFLMNSLTNVNISRNRIERTFPETVSPLSNIITLDLDSNRMSGAIPSEISNMAKIKYLILSNNSFAALPDEFYSMSSLIEISLHTNDFKGKIPIEFGNMINIEVLNISDNFFDGNIPSSISNLKKLTYLELERNELEGDLPPIFDASFSELYYLNISTNNFHITDECAEKLVLCANGKDSFELNISGNSWNTGPYYNNETTITSSALATLEQSSIDLNSSNVQVQ